MKKRLCFLYRYFTASRRWRRWINPQSLLICVASAVFLFTLSWTAPLSAQDIEPTPTMLLTPSVDPLATPTRTPLPAEFIYNSEQTIGITFAAAVLVLIVVVGVLAFLPKKTEE